MPAPPRRRRSPARAPASGRRQVPPPGEDLRGRVEETRRLKDRFMATQPESPFSEAGLPFHGLKYFPVDLAWRVQARYRAAPSPVEVWLRTSQDGHASMRKLGSLSFQVGGTTHRLALFHAGPQAGNVAFLPFRDRTSGQETYGPGRYLNLELVADGAYILDFNEAFNPYCAYTAGYECPFPPVENDLAVAVRAGEKVYDPSNNPASPQEAIRLLTVRFRERLASRGKGSAAPPPHGSDSPPAVPP